MAGTPLWVWLGTIGIVLAIFALDFAVTARRPHSVGLAEATWYSVLYIGIALLFGVVVWLVLDARTATEYITGWAVEKSLSVDNLFIFVIIIGRFGVPPEHQQKLLLFGIAAALLLRAVLIAAGAAAIELFSPTFLVFGLLLIWTAVQLARHRKDDPDPEHLAVLRYARRILPTTTDFHEGRLLARVDNRRVVTPMFLAFLTIGSTDLLFALDSIPAVFGVTRKPFVVLSANAFALLGLRALYFLLQGLLGRLIYLSLGLAAILAFIGVKLVLSFLHEDVTHAVPMIPTGWSLAVVLGVLAVTAVASLLRTRGQPRPRAHAGALGATRHRDTRPPGGRGAGGS